MARDWSKQRRREAAKRTAGEAVERARYLAELEAPDTKPSSKAELRAEADRLVAEYRGPVRRLATVIEVRCPCGHRGKVRVPPGRPRPRLRCRRCGTRL